MEILKVILTSLWSLVTLFILAKFMGHKQIAQLDLFDYITGITIGSIAAELATELENPILPFIAMVIYGVVTVLLSILSNKFYRLRKYINGTPTILMNNGKIYRDNMKKAKLDLNEFLLLCRQEGYFDLNSIQMAIFEYNGKVTILPKSSQRPTTPSDLNIQVNPTPIFTEIIMDGRIIDENLKKIGLDIRWLKKQLKSQGYGSTKEVFLGLCDDNNQLSLFKGE